MKRGEAWTTTGDLCDLRRERGQISCRRGREEIRARVTDLFEVQDILEEVLCRLHSRPQVRLEHSAKSFHDEGPVGRGRSLNVHPVDEMKEGVDGGCAEGKTGSLSSVVEPEMETRRRSKVESAYVLSFSYTPKRRGPNSLLVVLNPCNYPPSKTDPLLLRCIDLDGEGADFGELDEVPIRSFS